MCSGVLHAAKTSRAGELNTRVTTYSRPLSGSFTGFVCAAISFLLGSHFFHIGFQTVEAFVPEATEIAQPHIDILQWFCVELHGARLRLTASANQPRVLQHLQV